MKDPAISTTRTLALWLITREAPAEELPERNHGAFGVCEKLRKSLSTLAGAAGYRSLISRALTLAQKEAPSLRRMHVKEDGTLEFSIAQEPQQDADERQREGVVLVAHLLGLLASFIGLALTLRLVRDVWPDVPFTDMNSEMETKS
ncbi:MAG: hypothetical protein A4E57_02858 [Syntrophorhabdaceae bacterium PtaU1.Bin034]|jgi:hypothetical protein|nr:MAG: hypothetical protein A4E57_02858 [Syntrophorhabdaceae bacterium PtaU1.Bin034]